MQGDDKHYVHPNAESLACKNQSIFYCCRMKSQGHAGMRVQERWRVRADEQSKLNASPF